MLEILHSDDDTFFGGDVSSDSSSFSEVPDENDEPSAKVPRLADDWSESEVEDESDPDDGDDVSEQNDGAEESTAEMTVADIERAVAEGCGCRNENHFSALPARSIITIQRQVREAKSRDKDIFLLGMLTAGQHEEEIAHAGHSASAARRERVTFRYIVKGQKVCRNVFCTVYGVGSTRLKRLQRHVRDGVCIPQVHANVGKTPWNRYSLAAKERAMEFITNYASVFGLPMPAAPRGRANTAPTYLPSSCTFQSVWTLYCQAQQGDEETMGYHIFLRLWHRKLPSIVIMSPRIDVCARCERLRNEMRNAGSEQDKLQTASELKSHVELAQSERDFYKSCISRAKAEPDTFVHITFDFTENFGLPYHARQPGPVYFKVLFRVNDFGIINEASGSQIHHLYHEGQTIGEDNAKSHGPNCVVSMLHSYLEKNEHPQQLHAHCDNCCGQNKNKTMLAYLCWRVLVGLEADIKLSFMVVGHTRCAVDGGFGVVKKKFRSSDTDTASQLVDLVNSSGLRNTATLCDWQWRSWDSFFMNDFKRVVGITSYQHFHFSSEFPGKVKLSKTHCSDEVTTLQLVKDPEKVFSADDLPPLLAPAGLSDHRRKYLQDNVLQFCRIENRQAFSALLA